ncbi:hypothetical protein phiVC8_p40 [Vibrio phage phiVC8]|uniref:Uncharacterized protein n=1 Tax=Vibrio phage phiVC8 TaxID=1076759 RepID=G3FFP9_BPVC8|nr:hypothetical protein phiVC8_p40 [Vibrio phage phiVC8]AEM62937.1 hypothetical protein phiVC8_p40 [Vibrio phage phiVC8]
MVTHPQEENQMSTEIQTYGLSTVDLNELKSIEVAIREEYNKVEMTAKKAFIQMGGLLDDARRLINDDIKFGEWRVKNTPFESKENANKAMLLHRAVKDGTISQKMLNSDLGQSHLLELKDAPLSVQADVEKLIETGNIPSVKNIRDMKKIALAAAAPQPEKGMTGERTRKSTEAAPKAEPTQEYIAAEKSNESPIKRSPAEQYLDRLGEVDFLIEKILKETEEMHVLADKKLGDPTRKEWLNAFRRKLKELKDMSDDHYEVCEHRN